MTSIRSFSAALVVTAMFATVQSRAAAAPETSTGIKIGAKIPAFTLKDQNDREISSQSLLGNGYLALVFYRSADWWPFCQRQLVELQNNLKRLQTAGIRVVGVSYDSVEILKAFATKRDITFPLLSDPDSKTIDAFGIRNVEAKGSRIDGVPYPGTFVIDFQGIVRAKLFEEGYRTRHTSDALIEAVERLKASDKSD